MTTRPYKLPAPKPPPDGIFPDFPPRDDMQNPIHLFMPGYLGALLRHFGSLATVLVHSEIPLGWTHRQRAGILIPDLMIAFDVNAAAVIARNGYSIAEMGKPPDFVLEVASPSTARNDYERKRKGYANYGVPEYWRFDPTGGNLYPEPLAGDRLVDGQYVPIFVDRDNNRYWGRSDVLGLDICWEYGHLRWRDPASGSYLLTHDQEAEGRIAAEAQRDAHRQARAIAETQRDAAEAQRDAAQARIRELEAEIRRLQNP